MNDLILVPTDFTEVGDFAIEHAIGCAKQTSSRVCILHVINKDTKSYLKKNNLTQDSVDSRLQQKADDVKAKHGVEVEYIVREGSIFSAISEVAIDIGAMLIILGTHGKVGIQHVVGSYARKVIISAPCTVIVVQETQFKNGYERMVIPVDNSTETRQKMKWAIFLAKIQLYHLSVPKTCHR
ncbi:MAG: universal stress protein [Bacteroidetes bacterium]|nr:universal stress protein [Bacteroidota bacterium]